MAQARVASFKVKTSKGEKIFFPVNKRAKRYTKVVGGTARWGITRSQVEAIASIYGVNIRQYDASWKLCSVKGL